MCQEGWDWSDILQEWDGVIRTPSEVSVLSWQVVMGIPLKVGGFGVNYLEVGGNRKIPEEMGERGSGYTVSIPVKPGGIGSKNTHLSTIVQI